MTLDFAHLTSGLLRVMLDFSLAWLWVVPLAVVISRRMLTGLVVDTPNHRSSHATFIPKAGGVAFVVPCALYTMVLALVEPWCFLLFLPAFGMAIMGYKDDRHNLSWRLRLIFQGVLALVPPLVLLGHAGAEGWPLGQWSPWAQSAAILLGALWLVGMSNITNFMDGIDGIATLQGLGVTLVLTWVAAGVGQYFTLGMAYYLALGLGGFLVFNFPKARLFMGDVGSQFLGFVLGTLGLALAAQDPHTAYVVPLLMLNFLFDGGLTLVLRWHRQENIFTAHRSHLYQRCTAPGLWPHWKMSLLSLGFVGGQALMVMGNELLWQQRGWATLVLFLPPLGVQIIFAVYVFCWHKGKLLKE